METKILSFTSPECLEIINSNNVLAIPTETVFGLGIVYDSQEAFDRLCSLKNRVPDKPFTIMVSEKEQIAEFVDLNERMKRLIDKFMPGEITILFPTKEGLYPWLTLNQKTVGIRISNSDSVRELIRRVGKPMLVTSANMSGERPLLNDKDVYDVFNQKVLGIVQGQSVSNVPSTIVLIDQGNLKLIRKGSIPFEDILEVWNYENIISK